jgi:hypothetical protein
LDIIPGFLRSCVRGRFPNPAWGDRSARNLTRRRVYEKPDDATAVPGREVFEVNVVDSEVTGPYAYQW